MRNLKSKGHLSPLANSAPDSEEKLTLDANEGEGQGYFQRYASEGSPFEGPQEEEENEDVFSGAGVSGTIDFLGFWICVVVGVHFVELLRGRVYVREEF